MVRKASVICRIHVYLSVFCVMCKGGATPSLPFVPQSFTPGASRPPPQSCRPCRRHIWRPSTPPAIPSAGEGGGGCIGPAARTFCVMGGGDVQTLQCCVRRTPTRPRTRRATRAPACPSIRAPARPHTCSPTRLCACTHVCVRAIQRLKPSFELRMAHPLNSKDEFVL